MTNAVIYTTPTFNDLLAKDCGCIANSTYLDLVDGLSHELDELREALLFSKNLDSYSPNSQTIDVAIGHVYKIKTMLLDLRRRDVQSVNRMFAIVKYLIYIGGMRIKLSAHALDELADCGFIVNRLIGMLTNSAYTCIVNDQLYRRKVYTRLTKTGCIRSPRHKCKGK